jgi:hypothetical protein
MTANPSGGGVHGARADDGTDAELLRVFESLTPVVKTVAKGGFGPAIRGVPVAAYVLCPLFVLETAFDQASEGHVDMAGSLRRRIAAALLVDLHEHRFDVGGSEALSAALERLEPIDVGAPP